MQECHCERPLSDLNDTKHRVASLRQLSFLQLWLHLAQHILVMCILSVVHIQKFTIRYDFKVTTTAGGDPIIIS